MPDERQMSEHDLPVAWEQLKDAFKVDGSWRDIYVLETDLNVWERVLGWIRGLGATGVARLEYEPEPVPKTVAEIMEARAVSSDGLLKIYIDGLQINCHFFGELQIEFDIDPREVKGPAEARVVLDFMRGLASAANDSVHLTEENMSGWRWLTYDPRSDQWQFLPRGPF
jgi:hypothetical protein